MAPTKNPKNDPQPANAGYPEIEKLIDSEDFEEVNQAFTDAYNKLEKLAKSKKSLKTPREAKKGMKSLELTMDLFRELLEIKYQLQEEIKLRQQGSGESK
jgi:hypothetical protein